MEPRSSRAKIGTWMIAMARMTVHWDGLAKIAAMENAISSEGIESITSTTRITAESTQPPMPPARMPRVRPPSKPPKVASTPTIRVCCDPTINLDSRSRPAKSAPRGKPSWGGGTGLACWFN